METTEPWAAKNRLGRGGSSATVPSSCRSGAWACVVVGSVQLAKPGFSVVRMWSLAPPSFYRLSASDWSETTVKRNSCGH